MSGDNSHNTPEKFSAYVYGGDAPGTSYKMRDNAKYTIGPDGSLRRKAKKVKGKAAVKAHKRARQRGVVKVFHFGGKA